MTTSIDVDAYLARIGYTGPTIASIETLRRLHVAHLQAVPFENLDIHIGRKIVLDETRFVEKIVGERRGGFCYELNGAFAALLRALGFRVAMLSAAVVRPDGSLGPNFDHMLLLVELEEQWLADVGFGDLFVEPIRVSEEIQRDGEREFQVLHDGDGLLLMQRDGEAAWSRQYRFTLTPYELSDFAAMCHVHQTSPDSHFTRNRVCSRLTPAGRTSLTNNRLIVTDAGQRHETAIANDADFASALLQHFDIVLPTS